MVHRRTSNMNAIELGRLLSEKGKPCLSMIIPTMPRTRARMQNPELVEKAVAKVRSLLNRSAWPREMLSHVEDKLDELVDQIDYMRLQEGLAVFISPNIFKTYLLPFPVKEKVLLGQTFEIRDLVYFEQFLHPYLLLAVSRKKTRLFQGQGRNLQEVVNADFPKKYIEEYEYERPGIASASSPSLKSFERDKSIVTHTRMEGFFKEANESLRKYVKDETQLFLAGVAEDISAFEQTCSYGKHIAGRITGNYDIDALHPLAEIMWTNVRDSVNRRNLGFVNKYEEAVGKQMGVDGIADVWRYANEGNAYILLLEKDYQETAYIKTDGDHLFLRPPAGEYEIIHDAADDLIEMVIAKGGNVILVENGALKKFQRIALLLRYSLRQKVAYAKKDLTTDKHT